MLNFLMAIVVDAFGALKDELAEKNVQSVPAELRTLGSKFWEKASRAAAGVDGHPGGQAPAVVPENVALEMLLKAQRAQRTSTAAVEAPAWGADGAAAGRARVLPVRFGDGKRVYVPQEELQTLLIPEIAEARRLKEAAERAADGSVVKMLQRARRGLHRHPLTSTLRPCCNRLKRCFPDMRHPPAPQVKTSLGPRPSSSHFRPNVQTNAVAKGVARATLEVAGRNVVHEDGALVEADENWEPMETCAQTRRRLPLLCRGR